MALVSVCFCFLLARQDDPRHPATLHPFSPYMSVSPASPRSDLLFIVYSHYEYSRAKVYLISWEKLFTDYKKEAKPALARSVNKDYTAAYPATCPATISQVTDYTVFGLLNKKKQCHTYMLAIQWVENSILPRYKESIDYNDKVEAQVTDCGLRLLLYFFRVLSHTYTSTYVFTYR